MVDLLDEAKVALLRGDVDGALVHNAGGVLAEEAEADGGLLDRVVDRGLHVLGLQGATVAVGHVVPQGEAEGVVADVLPLAGEHWLDREIGAEVDERLAHVGVQGVVGTSLAVLRGVDPWVGCDAHGQLLYRGRRGRLGVPRRRVVLSAADVLGAPAAGGRHQSESDERDPPRPWRLPTTNRPDEPDRQKPHRLTPTC